DSLHQNDRRRNLPHRALDLRMAGMPDEDEGTPLRDVALALVVDLGDQRTGGVEHRERPIGGLLLDAARHPMRAENRDGVVRYFRKRLDEAGAFRLQALDHMLVMDDLMAHVDRRSILLKRA